MPATPLVLADRRRLKQVIINLLSNAIKFTRASGTVSVGTGVDDAGPWIRVTDTGIGMRADQIPLALQAFGQVESSHAREYGGTGLGLPLCRSLVELHGGTLELQSEERRGTVVTVRLPRARLVVQDDAAPLAHDPRLAG